MKVRLPFVSRLAYELLLQAYNNQREASLLREERLMTIIESFGAPSGQAVQPTPQPEAAFAFPPEVMSAVQARSRPGTKLEASLLKSARLMLANGDTPPEKVVQVILDGDPAIEEIAW